MFNYVRTEVVHNTIIRYVENCFICRFPLDDEVILKKWISAVGRKGFSPLESDFVCSKHFHPECIENGILKRNAVPSSINNSRLDDITDYDICRICGKAKETAMTDIFDEDLDICEKMSLCLPIIINSSDSLPQAICDECLEQLNVAVKLVKKAVATDEKLRPLLVQDCEREPIHLKPLPLFGPIVCDICGHYFADMDLFDSHMAEHKQAGQPKTDTTGECYIACTSCGHIFCDWSSYHEHKDSTPHLCDTCLATHENKCISNIHKCSKFRCSQCDVVLNNETTLKKHISLVHSKKKLLKKIEKVEIPVDPRETKPQTTSRRNRNPLRKELYHCNLCDVKFNTNKKLRDHCIEYHGTSNVLWICKFCGKSMTTKVSLQIHERIHFDSKPYICEWCGNGYRSRANLNQHQVIHTGVRNHECPQCGKRFSRKAFVRTHMRVHTGERPYVCDICGHRFTQLGDMKRHRNRHQNPHVPAYPSDRVYACDFCGEHFTQLTMLKKHRLQHQTGTYKLINGLESESNDLTIDLEYPDNSEEIEITQEN